MSIRGFIRLKDLKFYSYHGWHTEENLVGGRYSLDIEVSRKFSSKNNIDLEDTVNYAEIYEIAVRQMNEPRRLLEEVVVSIGNEIRDNFSDIGSVKVCLKKIDLPLGSHAGTAEVEMEF